MKNRASREKFRRMTNESQTRALREAQFWDRFYQTASLPGSDPGDERLSPELEAFHARVLADPARRVLSIGGGVDGLGVQIASRGAEVLSIDVSPIAVEKTAALSVHHACGSNLTARVARCEELGFENEFDLVISKGVLHHLDFSPGLLAVHRALKPGGRLIATEPFGFSPWIRAIQSRFPYHPTPHSFTTEDEFKLSPVEIDEIRQIFREIEITHFEFLARQSVSYLLNRSGLGAVTRLLDRADAFLMPRFAWARHFSEHGIIRAVK